MPDTYCSASVKALVLLFSCSVMCDSFVTPRTVACQVPLPMGLPRQEHWRGLPLPPSEDLPDSGIKFMSSAMAGEFFTVEPLGKPFYILFDITCKNGNN